MEHLLQIIKDYGPAAVAAMGGLFLKLQHRAIKRWEKAAETAVKADLAFDEVSKRVPEYAQRFETWKAHR